MTFFIGLRKVSVTPEEFLARLSRHVKLVAESFRGRGLKGYVAIAHEGYEAAYMLWESRAAMSAAWVPAAAR